ncbi:MAG: ImmA/IrrE family metallo-endopeptidase [Methylococcales bacterium]
MSKKEIERLYLDELAITEPCEIDIEAIAYYKGAVVKKRYLNGCEARIIGHGDRAIISINSNSSLERYRFSIGHELGHWFKHRGAVGNLCKKNDIKTNRSSSHKSVSGKEKVANEYASELLMPGYLFSKHIRGSTISFDVILSIKESFQVSLTAAAIRYVNFCDFAVILCCYGRNGRKWFHKSKFVPEYVYPVRSIDKSSPGYQEALSGKNKHITHEVDADTWIDSRGAENHEVMEVVWNIGDGNMMVFIWWQNVDHLDDSEEIIERPSYLF